MEVSKDILALLMCFKTDGNDKHQQITFSRAEPRGGTGPRANEPVRGPLNTAQGRGTPTKERGGLHASSAVQG